MSRTVLVCDGSTFVRRAIRETLETAGYQVVAEAESGPEALEKYRALRPDLVVLELVLPALSGADTVRELLAGDPDAAILVCSALAQPALIDSALQAGARGFLPKPFRPSQLLEAVQRALG